MMNRVLGVLFTLLTFVLIAFAILNWGNYHSMLFEKGVAESEITEAVVAAEGEEAITPEEALNAEDGVAVEAVDSLTVAPVL